LKQEELEVKSAKGRILKMFGIKRFFEKRKERQNYLEENLLDKKLCVATDTFDLSRNLAYLERNNLNSLGFNGKLSRSDRKYICKRLIEKADLIRDTYDNGEFDSMARKFEKTASELRKPLFKLFRIELDFSIRLNPSYNNT